MNILGHQEFAAARRVRQDEAIEILIPHVIRALRRYERSDRWWQSILTHARDLFYQVLGEDSGDPALRDLAAWRKLAASIRTTLPKTGTPDELTARIIATWLATYILNAAAETAAKHSTEELVLVWVTMHDSHVRPAHKAADNQARAVGEKFEIGGVEMSRPGDPSAPIELWINCRCAVRPATPESVKVALSDDEGHYENTSSEEQAMTDTVTEETTEEAPVVTLTWHSVLAPEGEWSGDGRRFMENSLRFRDLPLPITWQKESGDGHSGSVVVAKADRIERVGNEMRASGSWLATPEADEAIGLVAEFGKFGISVDADDAEAEVDEETGQISFTSARIASAAMVPIPAFSQAFISLGEGPPGFMSAADMPCDPDAPDYEDCVARKGEKAPQYAVEELVDIAPGRTEDGPGWLTNPEDTDRLRDYWTHGEGAVKIGWGAPGDFNRCRLSLAEYVKPEYLNGYCANRHYDALGFWPGEHHQIQITEGEVAPSVSLVASGGWCAPSEWFKDPELKQATALTVTDEGRVFGHLAAWNTCHTAYKGTCVSPPHSTNGYAYFLTGEVVTDAGRVPVGQVTMDTGHAKPGPMRSAIAHYDNTGTVIADVTCGEDEYGIWLAGWVRPGTSEERVTALRASTVSGDWRRVNSNDMDLIGALGVNSGGFPIPRFGVEDGVQMSLVAAGVVEESEPLVDTEAFARMIGQSVGEYLEAQAARKNRMAELAAKHGGGQ